MDTLLFPLLLALLAGFMFLSIRKQKKRMADMQEMQNSVATGARVQTTAGLFATVIDASSSDFVDLEIATGVIARFNKLAIVRVVPTEDAAETYPGHFGTRPEEITDEPSSASDVESFDDDTFSADRPADKPSDDK